MGGPSGPPGGSKMKIRTGFISRTGIRLYVEGHQDIPSIELFRREDGTWVPTFEIDCDMVIVLDVEIPLALLDVLVKIPEIMEETYFSCQEPKNGFACSHCEDAAYNKVEALLSAHGLLAD